MHHAGARLSFTHRETSDAPCMSCKSNGQDDKHVACSDGESSHDGLSWQLIDEGPLPAASWGIQVGIVFAVLNVGQL